jgi:hypothetical protein
MQLFVGGNGRNCSLLVTASKRALRAICRNLFWHRRVSQNVTKAFRKRRSVNAVANSLSPPKFSLESFHNIAGRSTSTIGRSESADSSPARMLADIVSSISCVCSANAYLARSTPNSTMYSPSEASPCLHKTSLAPSASRSKYDLSG